MTLTPAEIAGMRDTVVDVQFETVCTIERRMQTGTDPNGQPLYAWQVLYDDVPCHYWPAQQVEIAGVVQNVVTRQSILMEARTDVRTTDRVSEVRSVDGDVVAGPLDIEEVLVRLNDVLLRLKGIE